MRIGIFGAGSVGCYVGGMLAAAGLHVIFVGRETMAERLSGGIVLTRFDGLEQRAAPEDVSFSTDPSALRDCDVILVCVKSDATETAARALAKAARPDALVVSLQNGVSNAARLRDALAPRSVLAGMVGFNVAQIGSSRFHCGTEGEIVIEADPSAGSLVRHLNDAGVITEESAEIDAVQWGKLILNLNNAVNALSELPLKQQLARRAYRQVLAASIREALLVLREAGIRPAKVGKVGPALLPAVLNLPDWLFLRLAGSMLKLDDDATSSMAEDLARGRQPEIHWLNGEIVALGRKTGTATPVNERIVALVESVFAGDMPGGLTGEDLRRAALHPAE
ncbi:2-dehydropantoate 2-reductase [Oricola sp.]|uniref:2-dehydropantoate 2-reductase n=1 Tax=Oricola sp. TaxID=1979950 RepID=UPI0025EACC93|nr:2-dehydropantoate 2-reductase [Oricola sp.]MCI5075026.1 2-dehydropantoate 2-reductase [Oricola sp.]